jgi:hypothetical protein
MNPLQHLPAIWTEAHLPADALNDVLFTGTDPVLPSSFAVGTAAQDTVAASALAAADAGRWNLARAGFAGADRKMTS